AGAGSRSLAQARLRGVPAERAALCARVEGSDKFGGAKRRRTWTRPFLCGSQHRSTLETNTFSVCWTLRLATPRYASRTYRHQQASLAPTNTVGLSFSS